MYPEYSSVDDDRIIDKLHRMYFPNFTDDDFRKTIYKPANDATDDLISDVYLKRADAYLALRDFQHAAADYKKINARLLSEKRDYRRWRIPPPGMGGVAVDLQTLRVVPKNRLSLWMRSVDANGDSDGTDPVEYQLDCANRTVAVGDASHWIDPAPSSHEEAIRDYFCH